MRWNSVHVHEDVEEDGDKVLLMNEVKHPNDFDMAVCWISSPWFVSKLQKTGLYFQGSDLGIVFLSGRSHPRREEDI